MSKMEKHIEYYPNGKIKEEGTYKDGEKDEKWTYWHENGQKKSEGTYKDGETDGLWTKWHENGQKKVEATFNNYKFIEAECWNEDGNECECGDYWFSGCK